MNARKSKRLAALVILSLALTAGTYAFAAANTVPASNAGDGDNVISGYTVDSVVYDISTDTDPTDFDSVGFNVVPDAGGVVPGEVWVKLDSTSTTYFSCANGVGNAWTCAITDGELVLNADELRVIAAD